jgi:hypothetical protein
MAFLKHAIVRPQGRRSIFRCTAQLFRSKARISRRPVHAAVWPMPQFGQRAACARALLTRDKTSSCFIPRNAHSSCLQAIVAIPHAISSAPSSAELTMASLQIGHLRMAPVAAKIRCTIRSVSPFMVDLPRPPALVPLATTRGATLGANLRALPHFTQIQGPMSRRQFWQVAA